ncbi:Sensor protein DivL [Pseudoruegeria aquimaris]|uniref:Sensor protein DivL n=1 Tax=Pseudoruegeria aquimaris TaxID=393663 RepID=A0A1Y5RSC4_9RHOB|nr:PAS-domain containing protein [Pseudoruegeria aquimaris]SLN24256.1 Sensor protein DivL [Pseudoruegeria aquimaris]
MDPSLALATVLLSVAAAALTTLALGHWPRRPGPAADPATEESETSFLFEGARLVDASGPASGLLETAEKRETDLLTLVCALKPRFPGLDTVFSPQSPAEVAAADAEDGGESRHVFPAHAPEDPARIELCRWEEFIRITLSQPVAEQPEDWECGFLRQENRALRQLLNKSPYPIWRQTSGGEITWANAAYLDLAAQQADIHPEDARGWPPVRLFSDISLDDGTPEGKACRVSLRLVGRKEEAWFECRSFAAGRESLHYAADASATVTAQRNLEHFVQTLTKTFAHLPIGLAIFDRGRRLALFNPAMGDLTGLPADFLSQRPTLDAVFDRLRESRMLPEPRNYAEWRRRITQAETESANGIYEETWSLPSGRTFRLTGRPHPDNAIAFLLEDISTEVSLTRHFRAELEISQSVLDTVEDAIAVFSEGGRLAFTNRAFAQLWFGADECALSEFTIFEASRIWREQCHPTPVWGDLREFAAAPTNRSEWEADIRMVDGRALRIVVSPLPGNATLVRFRAVDAAIPFVSARLNARRSRSA